MNTKLVKLVSGEEVIFEVGEETGSTVEMKNPITLHVVPQGGESYGLQLFPYSPTKPDGIHTLNKNQIVSTTDVPEDLTKAYVQRTTGIQIVSSL